MKGQIKVPPISEKSNKSIEFSDDINKNLNRTEIKKTNFENHIIEVYKILSGYYNELDQKKNKNIKLCEIEMRKAFDICQNNEKINLNKNILDKISRIINHKKINILFILSKIFMILMQKNNLFEKKDDLNNLIIFINEICNLDRILKETHIGYKFNKASQKFIEKIISEFTFETEQIKAIKNLLNAITEKMKPCKLNLNSFEEMILSLNELLQNQESHLMQYKIIIDNYMYILGMITNVDLDERNNLENYIELGKILALLLYNNKYVIFLKKQSSEAEGVIKLFYDGKENNHLINAIEGEKFFIECENEIEEMREKICELVLKYVEKYKGVINIFDFQYVLYVLSKKLFFLYDGKFRDKIEPIIAEIMINLCFYKVNSIEEIKIFIKEILNSNNKKDKNFKDLLKRKIDFIKMNPNFQLNLQNKKQENYTNIENISNEALFLLEGDLKISYFLSRLIKNGEHFTFYVELTEPYSILDFCVLIEQYDIKLSIIDLSTETYIIKNIEVNAFSSPYKICLFFTKPVICKFIFDNTYSWIRDKNIKYKTNIFYPQKSFYIQRNIILFNYQEKLYLNKNINNRNNARKNSGKNLFLIKFNGQNKAFNMLDVYKNIETCDKLLEEKYISIYNIYISKYLSEENISYFYFKTNDKIEKFELNKENFENFLIDNISKNSHSKGIDIVNLYLLSRYEGNNISVNTNNEIIIKNIEDFLGFSPKESRENNENKILYFNQYLFQAIIIYFLYKSFMKKENKDIVFLLNFSEREGIQIYQYKDGEIKLNNSNYFIEADKAQNIEKKVEIFIEEIKKYEYKRKVDMLISSLFNEKENDFDVDKINNLIKKNLNTNIKNEEENNFCLHKLDNEFIKEVEKYSHIFYLD